MKNFKMLYDAGRIQRYHTSDVTPQSVAAHSWGVAMIVCRCYPKDRPIPQNLIMAAMTHDMAEAETGDIPAPAKWDYPQLGKVLDQIEQSFNETHGIDYKLTPQEARILEWADTFELVLWCSVHRHLVAAEDMLLVGHEILARKGFPTTEAKELYDEFFN
jgi:5'-deoxynucleotidase YfbR-like HD superfamily hydrolase